MIDDTLIRSKWEQIMITRQQKRNFMNYVEARYWKGSPNQAYADKAYASYVTISSKWNKK